VDFVVDLLVDDTLVVGMVGNEWADLMGDVMRMCDRMMVGLPGHDSNNSDVTYAYTPLPLSTSRPPDVDLLHSTRCH
jgi:hypothetical protein